MVEQRNLWKAPAAPEKERDLRDFRRCTYSIIITYQLHRNDYEHSPKGSPIATADILNTHGAEGTCAEYVVCDVYVAECREHLLDWPMKIYRKTPP